MKKVKLFEKGPSYVADRINDAARWICEDWPEGCGFQTSDRNAVFSSALRDTIGAENAEGYFKGKVEISEIEMALFKNGVNNAISANLPG